MNNIGYCPTSPSPTGCQLPGQLSLNAFQYQTESGEETTTYCNPLCYQGTASFYNVVNSEQALYQITAQVTSSKYIAIPFQVTNASLPSYFSLVMNPTPLVGNSNIIGCSSSSPSNFSIPNLYRINFLGGTSLQYSINSSLAGYGQYMSLVENGNDTDTSSITSSMIPLTGLNILQTNTPQVLYLEFSTASNNSTNVSILLQQGNNLVNMFTTQNSLGSFTIPVAFNVLQGYSFYIATSTSNQVALYDYTFSQTDLTCPYYYPGPGGGSQFQLYIAGSTSTPTSY